MYQKSDAAEGASRLADVSRVGTVQPRSTRPVPTVLIRRARCGYFGGLRTLNCETFLCDQRPRLRVPRPRTAHETSDVFLKSEHM